MALALVILTASIVAFTVVYRRIQPALRARNHVERIIRYALIACSTLAIFCTVGIVLSVLFESIRFFQQIPVSDFLFGLEMESPDGHAGGSGREFRQFRGNTGYGGNLHDYRHCHVCCCAGGSAFSGLFIRVRWQYLPGGGETAAGDSGWAFPQWSTVFLPLLLCRPLFARQEHLSGLMSPRKAPWQRAWLWGL